MHTRSRVDTVKLSEHFSTYEFDCKGGACIECGGGLGPVGISEVLLKGLEEMRNILGGDALFVTSGYRCPESNKNSTSQHCAGQAADVFVIGSTFQDLHKAAEGVAVFRDGGIGIYPKEGGEGYPKKNGHDFVHVDVRKNGPARWGRWCGQYFGIVMVEDLWKEAMKEAEPSGSTPKDV